MDQHRRDVPVAQDRNELPCPDRRSNDQMLTAMRCPLRKVLQPANFVRHCTLIAARQGRAVRPLCPLSERKFRRRCHSPRTTSRSLRRSASGKALNSLVYRSTAGALHRQRPDTDLRTRSGAEVRCSIDLRNTMANQGGSHEQHVRAAQSKSSSKQASTTKSSPSEGKSADKQAGSHEQHVKPGQRSHKNSHWVPGPPSPWA